MTADRRDAWDATITPWVWVLRAPCGCPHGAAARPMPATEAWAEVAPGRKADLVAAGWTLTLAPALNVLVEVRERLGECRHDSDAALSFETTCVGCARRLTDQAAIRADEAARTRAQVAEEIAAAIEGMDGADYSGLLVSQSQAAALARRHATPPPWTEEIPT